MHSRAFASALERQPSALFSNWTPIATSRLRNRALILSCALSITIYLIFTQDFVGHSGNFEALEASLRAPWRTPGLQDQISEASNTTAHDFAHRNDHGVNAVPCPTSLDICNCPEFDFSQVPPIEEPAFGIVSIVYGDAPPIYTKAVETHTRHAMRHNYRMDILKRPTVGGYWTKTSYMMSLIVAELSKPVGYRRKWLMWFDADTVILNDAIPVDILTPEFFKVQSDKRLFDDVMFVLARGDVGLNSAVFFARVHETTLDILVEAFSCRIAHTNEDPEHAYDTFCLSHTIADSKNRKHTLWTPRHWFNSGERWIQTGALMGQFLDNLQKEADMAEWVQKAEEGHAEARVPYARTFYPSEVQEFWHLNRECRQALVMSKRFTIAEVDEKDEFDPTVLALEETCTWLSDDISRLRSSVEDTKHRLSALLAKE